MAHALYLLELELNQLLASFPFPTDIANLDDLLLLFTVSLAFSRTLPRPATLTASLTFSPDPATGHVILPIMVSGGL